MKWLHNVKLWLKPGQLINTDIYSDQKVVYRRQWIVKKVGPNWIEMDCISPETTIKTKATIPSAYMVFALQARDSLKYWHPNATFEEIGRLLGSGWKNLDQHDRDIFMSCATWNHIWIKRRTTPPSRYQWKLQEFDPQQTFTSPILAGQTLRKPLQVPADISRHGCWIPNVRGPSTGVISFEELESAHHDAQLVELLHETTSPFLDWLNKDVCHTISSYFVPDNS